MNHSLKQQATPFLFAGLGDFGIGALDAYASGTPVIAYNSVACRKPFCAAVPKSVAVSGAARHMDEQGRPTGVIARLEQPGAADPIWVPSRELYLIQPFLMRRSDADRIGGYRYVY